MIEQRDANQKRCVKCGEWKDRSAFGRDKRRVDGLFPYCKRCRQKDPELSEFRAQMEAAGFRWCPECRQFLPEESFYHNRSTTSGFTAQCKQCHDLRTRKWERDHPERVLELKRNHYQRRGAIMKRRHYLRNREELIRKSVEYSRTPKGKAKQARANHLRRIRAAEAPATLTDEEWQWIIKRQGNKCLACGRKFSADLPPTRDHIIPVAEGGGLTIDNVAALCKSCNTAKKHRKAAYTYQKVLV